jgi:hypothetical protein
MTRADGTDVVAPTTCDDDSSALVPRHVPQYVSAPHAGLHFCPWLQSGARRSSSPCSRATCFGPPPFSC